MDADFGALARDYLDGLVRWHPDTATGLGDHRFDSLLPDLSPDALADERRALGELGERLAGGGGGGGGRGGAGGGRGAGRGAGGGGGGPPPWGGEIPPGRLFELDE